jgi:hypothetical protein
MSYVKVGILLVGLTSTVLGSFPPKSSRSVSTMKNDRIVKEDGPYKINTALAPIAAVTINAAQSALYLYLIVNGPRLVSSTNYPPMDKHLVKAILQLKEVQPWHLVATAGTIIGAALRQWSYIELSHFFTVSY